MRPVNLRARIEALERRAARSEPTLAVVTLYEGDDEAAAERWLSDFEARSPHGIAVIINVSGARSPGQPPPWSSPPGSRVR